MSNLPGSKRAPTAGGPSPFHEGEQQVQSRLGVRDDIEPWARRVVRSSLPEEHRVFFESLPFLVAAARDECGRPWATVLSGPEGFVRSPEPRSLAVDALPVPGDALHGRLLAGADLGLLGIELATRRRNRLNGRIAADGKGGFELEVGQSFGNCPQYIHERDWRRVPVSPTLVESVRSDRLDGRQKNWIRGADTFFIASGYRGDDDNDAYGMDASHRGGDAGFVAVDGDRTLVFPDYAGNNHYNTIGNLMMDPRAGFLFVDFETGGLLQLAGRVYIDWDSEALVRDPGARRLIVFEIEEVVELVAALPLRFSASAGTVRTLRLIDRVAESSEVTSFVFASRDGGPLPDFEAGQHLPIELDVAGRGEPVQRTYSISSAPGSAHYRISVKRETHGVASQFLHDAVEPGAMVTARAPSGDFVLKPGNRPVVLLSAGVGLTPIVSMLLALADDDEQRPVWFFHGARDSQHHALSQEVSALAADNDRIRTLVAYSQPLPEDLRGRDFDVPGRLDARLVAEQLLDLDAEFYICGPIGFMTNMIDGLTELGVPDERIHSESFGPVS